MIPFLMRSSSESAKIFQQMNRQLVEILEPIMKLQKELYEPISIRVVVVGILPIYAVMTGAKEVQNNQEEYKQENHILI